MGTVEVRRNVAVDRDLVERVKELYDLPSTSAAITFALRALLGTAEKRDMLDLEGAGWDGDLEEMRRSPRH